VSKNHKKFIDEFPSVGFKYSMRNQLYGVINYCAWSCKCGKKAYII